MNAKLGETVHFLPRLAPVQVPTSQVRAPGTGAAPGLHFPLMRKQVALIVITDLPLPPEGNSMFNPLDLYQIQTEVVGNDLFCLVWKQSSILTEFERHLQEGMCYFQGAILSRKGLIGSINYETSGVWHCGRFNFQDPLFELPQATNHLEACSSPHMAFPNECCLDAIISLHTPFPPISTE